MRGASEKRWYDRTHTARASSLSSIVLSASETASPTLTPPFFSSSAAARSRGFSLMLDVSYIVEYPPPHQINNSLPAQVPRMPRTLARSYAALAFLIASESWNLSTSPCSCFTFSCSSLFFRSSSLRTSTNVWKGDLGISSFRREVWWNVATDPAVGR